MTMKKAWGFVAVVSLLLAACGGAGSASGGGPVVVHNGMLIDGLDGEPVMDAAVVIEDGVIVAVGSESVIEIPAGATMIDAEGGTIMPGIINARTSLLLNELPITDGEIDPVSMDIFLNRPLKAGLTTVREAGGLDRSIHPDLAAVREALEAQGNQIPTMLVAVPAVMHAESNVFEIYSDFQIGVTTADEARQATEDLIAYGVDQITYAQAIQSDRRATENRDSRVGLSPEMEAAVIETAHEQGYWVLAQTAYPEDAEAAIAAGVDELAVWPGGDADAPISDDLIQAMVDNSISVITGFSVSAVRPYEDDVRRFIDAGGTIVMGTFAPNSGPLTGYPREMELMELLGQMTPMEIILAATANAAQVVGLGDRTGTLEVGKEADVIVVGANPLEDIGDMDNVTVVINNGEVIVGLDGEE